MKIITDKKCYVQGSDIENIIYYRSNITSDIYNKFVEFISSEKISKNFISIEDKDLIDYIMENEDILDFFDLYNRNINELDILMIKIKNAMIDFDTPSTPNMTPQEIAQAHISEYREKQKREYMLNQLKEIVSYKKRESQTKYPNVPNPYTYPIISDSYAANVSLDYNNVIVYNLEGNPIDEDYDVEFCKLAYRLLMSENFSEDVSAEEIETKLSSDKQFVSVEKIKKQTLNNKNKLIKKLNKKR